MNTRRGLLALVLAFSCCGLVRAVAQDDHRDNQQERQYDQDRDHNNDESRFYNNANYQRGWKDGQRHKHSKRRWKNDSDREAYESGYAHGNRGEQWRTPNHDRDQQH